MQWYHSQCDGDWEHEWGVEIGTLDNPGWRLKIDLDGTELEDVPFERLRANSGREFEWLTCWREGNTFHCACGPGRLEDAITIFVDWAQANGWTPPN